MMNIITRHTRFIHLLVSSLVGVTEAPGYVEAGPGLQDRPLRPLRHTAILSAPLSITGVRFKPYSLQSLLFSVYFFRSNKVLPPSDNHASLRPPVHNKRSHCKILFIYRRRILCKLHIAVDF
jgi:hypothetical protein